MRRPAPRRKSAYVLPDSSGKWNFANATGTLNLKGVAHVVLGKRSAGMKSVTFTRPAKGNGHVTVKVSNTPIAGPGAGTTGSGTSSGVTPTSTSGVGLSLNPAFRSLLNSVGLSTVPLVPGSGGLPAPLGTTTIPGADGSSVTLPLKSTAGGSFDQGTLTDTIPLSGGLQLDNGNLSVSLTNPELTLGTGTEGSSLSFEMNGRPEVKLLDIDTSQLEQAATPDGTLDLHGLLATLSSEGAASLNSILGTNAFTTGEPVGGVSVILPAAAAAS
jgi:hypothetical protein